MLNRSLTPFVALALVGPAAAQALYVPHTSQNGGRHLAAFDPFDGHLLSASVIDFDISGVTNRPVQAAQINGDWWITDSVTESVHVFAAHGVEYSREELLGNGDILGSAAALGSTWFCAQGPPFVPGTLLEVTTSGTSIHTLTVDSPVGVGTFNGELIVTHGGGALRFDPVGRTVIGDFYSTITQQGMQQPIVRPSTGGLLIARQAGHQDIVEFDAGGGILAEFDIGPALGLSLPFACMELGNGDLFLSTDSGAFVIDPALTRSTPVLEGVRCRYITLGPSLLIGANYCGPSVVNSTGRSATIAASGSSVAADQAVHLSVHGLPHFSSGYFITSQTQGSVVHPGGSSGNLCLGGAIGRHLNQVQNSSSVDFFEITVDASAVPQPAGALPILAGETWNWQAWYRDSIGGQATSNFTDAVSVPFS
ncbi:MAG: hypothetical protein R3F49_10165 [Planctomycetota bacterium]